MLAIARIWNISIKNAIHNSTLVNALPLKRKVHVTHRQHRRQRQADAMARDQAGQTELPPRETLHGCQQLGQNP